MNGVHCRVGSSASAPAARTRTALSPSRRPPMRPSARENQMMLRTQWYPFQDLRSAQEEQAQTQMDRLFAHARGLHGQRQGASTRAWAPALDISERKDAYLVTVELPGVKLDDLQITLEDGLLTIQGERHFVNDSSEEQFHRVERSSGAFRRSITLPAHVVADEVNASMEDGVLRILVPKAEEAKPKRIQVTPG